MVYHRHLIVAVADVVAVAVHAVAVDHVVVNVVHVAVVAVHVVAVVKLMMVAYLHDHHHDLMMYTDYLFVDLLMMVFHVVQLFDFL